MTQYTVENSLCIFGLVMGGVCAYAVIENLQHCSAKEWVVLWLIIAGVTWLGLSVLLWNREMKNQHTTQQRPVRVYLAGPYSHPDEQVRLTRERTLSKKCASLMLEGYVVFSPITHGHALLDFMPFETRTWEFWGSQDFEHMRACDEVHVLCLDGWEKSRGVKDEILWATMLRKKVVYYTQ